MITEHDNIVLEICKKYSEDYNIVNNLSGAKHYFGSILPDIILYDKTGEDIRFVIEVITKTESIAQCLQDWNMLKMNLVLYLVNMLKMNLVLYLVVPKEKLQNAKTIAGVIGIPLVKFASYEVVGDKIIIDWE
jgi:hypothetical protein